MSAYGGRGDQRYRDSARVVYYDGLQNLSNHAFRLGPSVGNHQGPRAKATPLLIRSRVFRWTTLTTGVAWYDVRHLPRRLHLLRAALICGYPPT